MWYDIYGKLPNSSTKDKLKTAQNNLEFQNVFNLLTNLVLDIFKWKNLPETCDEKMLENSLLWRNYAAFYDDGNAIWTYGAGPGGFKTRYGYPTDGNLYSLNGQVERCKFYWDFMDNTDAKGVLCMDNRQCYPFINYIMRGAERIADARRAVDVAAQNSKYPVLIQCSEEQRKSILDIYNDINANKPLIITDKDNNFDKQTNVFNLGADAARVKDLWDFYIDTYNDVLKTLGVKTNDQSDKKERMLVDEVNINEDFINKNLEYRLQSRKEFCERVNKAFGLNIDVVIKNQEEKEKQQKEQEEKLVKEEEQNDEV